MLFTQPVIGVNLIGLERHQASIYLKNQLSYDLGQFIGFYDRTYDNQVSQINAGFEAKLLLQSRTHKLIRGAK